MTSEARAAADRRAYWNARFAREPAAFGGRANLFVEEVVHDLPVGTALDAACGQGRNAVWLAERGHTVTGLDLSDVALEQAGTLAMDAGVDVEWVHADLTAWESARTFDLVLLSYLHLPPEARLAAHHRAVAAVAPGGHLVLVAHHVHNFAHGVGGPDDPAVLYDEAMMGLDFAALDTLRSEMVTRTVERDGETRIAYDLLYVGRRRDS